MRRKQYILYIEDEGAFIEVVRHALTNLGYEVAGVTSGQKGLTMLRQRPPDLLLLDLMMPGTNGWDIYRQLKTDDQLANIPVVVITARSPQQEQSVIIDDLPPVDGYLIKPFTRQQLLDSVQNFIPA